MNGGGLLDFVIASSIFSLIKLSKVSLLCCSVSEFSSDMLRGWIDIRGNIVALEVSTAYGISLPPFFIGQRTRPTNCFAAGDEFGVL